VYRYNPVTKQFQRLVSAKAVTYTSTGLTTGKAYTFKARAYKTVSGKNLYGAYSKTVTAKPVPAVPGAFKAAVDGFTSIKLSWNAVSGASGYTIYRYNTATKKYAPLKTVTALNYINIGLTMGTKYTYEVSAFRTVAKVNIYGANSATASATPSATVPGGFNAAAASSTSIQISWNAVTGASGYVLYSYNPVTKISTQLKIVTALSYTDMGLTTGTAYYYTIQAYKTVDKVNVFSNYSAPASATPVGSFTEGSVGKILASGKYTLSFDGQMDNNGTPETIPITFYVSGNKIAMKTAMDVSSFGKMDMTILFNGTKYYAIMPSMKVYFSLPADMAQELFQGFLTSNNDNTKYTGTSKVTYNGTEYLVEKYSDGSSTTDCYIKDGQLKRMVLTDNTGTVSTMENMSLSATVDSKVFVIPFGYIDMSYLTNDIFG